MINLKQNGSGQNINLSPIYHQIEVLDENTVLLSRRIDTIQTGSVDLSEIENSISILNNSVATVQTDITNIKSNTSILSNDIGSIKTELTSIVSDVSMLSSDLSNLSTNQVNYYDKRNKLTERPFNYNLTGEFIDNTTKTLSASIYGAVPVSSYKNLFVDIKADECYNCTFEHSNKGYSNLYANSFTKNIVKGENLILNGVSNNRRNTYDIGFLLGNYPTFSLNSFNGCINLDFHDQYFVKNTILTNYKINNNGLICENNSLSSVKILNLNNCSVNSNSLKNVNYLNCVGEIFGNNEYINQSDQQYQCQLMNLQISSNNFVYPDLLNVTCKMFATNTISNAKFVDMKCDHLISNEIYNVRFLKIHNVESGGYGFYSGIGDFYLENFSTKSANESISNVTKFRFNNGSTNLYDTNLNWTLTNSNYDLVESNVVHCGDFNPIPYIRSINQQLDIIETKLTQTAAPESDVFVKKINVPKNTNSITFTSAQSLKINCISVGHFKCSDIKSLKINGSRLEFGMFSNIKSVEINAVDCDELTFDNVEYIKVSCTNTPNIYCSNIGTVKLNNYNKIQLQKFNLFEAPQPNSFFNEQYIKNWNVNTSSSNPYDGHFKSDYIPTNDKTYANVKFKFNADSFTQSGYTTTIQLGKTKVVEEHTQTKRLLTWDNDTFKMCHSYGFWVPNGQVITYYNYLRNYQIQFDMPYVITSTVSQV